MATKTTIEMAREAAGDDWGLFQEYMPEIHRLVELVRADERARMAEQQTDWEAVAADQAMTIALLRAEQPAQQEDPCPGCRKGGVCRTPKCGRLKLPADHPYRTEQPAQPYKGLADHINQATNGRMRIDPVTGNVGIGTPSTPAQQEPVATLEDLEQEIYENTREFVSRSVMEWMLKRYCTPPPAQRKPLTDEEIEREWQFLHDEEGNPPDHHDFARAIEAAHQIGVKK